MALTITHKTTRETFFVTPRKWSTATTHRLARIVFNTLASLFIMATVFVSFVGFWLGL